MITVGVCGFGRCGSTMLMAMLDAGGVPPVEGSSPGGYELGDPRQFAALTPAAASGRAVKLLDFPLREDLREDLSWRIVWLHRNHAQQAASMVKFLRGVAGLRVPARRRHALEASYAADTPGALERLALLGPVLELRYDDVLARPAGHACRLARHLAPELDLDVDAAAAVVHQRSPKCRPDLSVELAALAAAGGRS